MKNIPVTLQANYEKIINKDKVKKLKFSVSPDIKVDIKLVKQRINDHRLYSGKWTIPKIEAKVQKKKKKKVIKKELPIVI
jgi:hypothetical protein